MIQKLLPYSTNCTLDRIYRACSDGVILANLIRTIRIVGISEGACVTLPLGHSNNKEKTKTSRKKINKSNHQVSLQPATVGKELISPESRTVGYQKVQRTNTIELVEPFTDLMFSEGKYFTRGKTVFLGSWKNFRDLGPRSRISLSSTRELEWGRESSSSLRIHDPPGA